MALSPTGAAASPEAQPPAPSTKPPALPPDMEGWLSTAQAAEAMGMEKRKFQDHADRYALPRRKLGTVGTPAYYDPDVIRSAVEAQAARAAEKEAEAAKQIKAEGDQKNERKRQQGEAIAAADPAARGAAPQPFPADLFHLEALAVLGQIVQQHGRTTRPR